jgi:hypothetical protein
MPITTDVKQKFIGVVSLLVIFILLGSLLILDKPQNSDLVAYEEQLHQIFEDAKIQFEHIRGVTLPTNIKLSICTKQQAMDSWGKKSSNSDAIDYILMQENIYKSLFLIAENDSLSDATDEWVASWTAVTVNNEIYVIYENFWPWDMPNAEAILIHELTHVWQNTLPFPTNYDADRAQNALREGDASYMADYYKTQYNNNNNNPNPQNYDYYPDNLPPLLHVPQLVFAAPSVPDAVNSLNWFPYIQGKTFVSAIVDNHGWDRLNQCYLQSYIPSTTAQILHPNKYFAEETAKPTLTPTPIDDSWTIMPSTYGYLSDTYGEYFIYIMLNQWLNTNQAQKAATGWSGDSLTYYKKDNDFLFIWTINWDSPQDASEFNQALTDMLKHTQAKPYDNNKWLTNNRYLTLTWNPNTQTTLIICSTNQTATTHHFSTNNQKHVW